jgi:type IV pilus assembly protein PilV
MNIKTRLRSRPRAPAQGGFMLLEVLVAILIFVIGVVGLLGLQAASIQQAAAAEYRATAQYAANDLISRMWITDRTFATLSANFVSATTPPAAYATWWAAWQSRLPGTSVTTLAPQVTITPVAGGGATPVPSSLVSINMQWMASDAVPHSFKVEAEIK